MDYEHDAGSRVRYLVDGFRLPDIEGWFRYGCWAFDYKNKEQVEAICDEALKNGVCTHIEHSMANEGTCYFFCYEDDVKAHQKITRYFVVKNLIPRDENGKLSNIAYRLPNGEEDTQEPLTLSFLIDLDTGAPTF